MNLEFSGRPNATHREGTVDPIADQTAPFTHRRSDYQIQREDAERKKQGVSLGTMKVPDFLNANRHGYARKGNESLDAGYG